LDRAAGLEQALRYRLVSPWTNWLVVAARADGEKALDIPALRKVPQTLAAGWGGVGEVAAPMSAGPMLARSAAFSRGRARGVAPADLDRDSRDGASEIESELSRLLLQAGNLKQGVETLTREAQGVVGPLHEHAGHAERELQAIDSQASGLRSAIDALRSEADVLRGKIGELAAGLEPKRQAAVQKQLHRRLADLDKLLARAEDLLRMLQERRMPLGHLQEITRKFVEAIMRWRD
jgi:hypothetical protein